MPTAKTIRYNGAIYHLAAIYEPKKGEPIGGAALQAAFPELTSEDCIALVAQAVEANSVRKVDEFLQQVDKAVGGFGVEAIRSEDDWDNYYGDAVALFIETGDVYNSTVLFDVEDNAFYVTTVGDWVEAWEHETGKKVK